MHKLAVAAAIAMCGLLPVSGALVSGALASVVPADGFVSPAMPADLMPSSLVVGTPQLEIGTVHVEAPRGDTESRRHGEKAPELSLRTSGRMISYTEFTVGRNSLTKLRQRTSDMNWRVPASTNTAAEWAFIRREVIGPEGLDALGEMFDVNEDERPWSDTTTVHVLAPTGNWFVPFATVAHEVDSNDSYERLGIGGGAQMTIGKNTTLGTEMIYFGDRLNDNNNGKETRVMAHLEIQF